MVFLSVTWVGEGGRADHPKNLDNEKKNHLNPIPCGGEEEGRIVYL